MNVRAEKTKYIVVRFKYKAGSSEKQILTYLKNNSSISLEENCMILVRAYWEPLVLVEGGAPADISRLAAMNSIYFLQAQIDNLRTKFSLPQPYREIQTGQQIGSNANQVDNVQHKSNNLETENNNTSPEVNNWNSVWDDFDKTYTTRG